MAYSQIDPARLQGDALRRWYLRSPADIEQARQEAETQRYNAFFGVRPSVSDPDGYRAAASQTSVNANDSSGWGAGGDPNQMPGQLEPIGGFERPQHPMQLAALLARAPVRPGAPPLCPSSEVLGQWGFGFSGGLGSSGVDI